MNRVSSWVGAWPHTVKGSIETHGAKRIVAAGAIGLHGGVTPSFFCRKAKV